MSKECAYCGKKAVFGRTISHAHNVSRRKFNANLQRVRAFVDGHVVRLYACTRCIRSGKVVKPPARSWEPEEATT